MERLVTEATPSDMPILTPDRRLRVFVSSTLVELAEELAGGGPCDFCAPPDPGDVRVGGPSVPATAAPGP